MVSRCRVGGFLISKLMKPPHFNSNRSMQALLNVSLHTSPRTSDFASLVLGSRLWPRGHSEDVALSQQKRLFCLQHTAPKPVLTLFTKDFCPLCDDALDELGDANLDKVTLETIDIEEEGNEEWFNKFRYEIPVFFLNKKFLCKNRIDLDAFNSALEEYHAKSER